MLGFIKTIQPKPAHPVSYPRFLWFNSRVNTDPDIINWPAPAKLNLFLHITSQREDGFHDLQTVFQFLDYADILRFYPRNDGEIRRAYSFPGVSEEADLILRAARLLQQQTKTELGVEIELEKILPLGGGLGGGSSDAATTLVALNAIWNTGLSQDELAQLGLQLGADVPVFVQGQAAWAEGVGEALTPVELPQVWFVVLIPAINVSTASVFADPQLRRDCPAITIRDFLVGTTVLNVCEPRVREQYPEVDSALSALGEYAPARMTGTGACVFAAFESESAARSAYLDLSVQWQGFVAQGLNQSPLKASLAAFVGKG
ncbi:4-diphosphocytidyl-2-C-methyl-D-erythritol kinase [hydrothermal vent metagenome]|uniref:4-(cytidine 5'-diphospho)-2-C-methyl-D-erythritol kinase n=1 Tax=hydrothermal vent metagenome TaxID=652676 RepID=A0A3B1ATT4_9ZZZZ